MTLISMSGSCRSWLMLATALTVASVSLSPHAVAATDDPITQPPNSIGVRLVDVPEDRAADPRALSAIIDHVIPGATVERRMEVVSTVDAPIEVATYGTNAKISDGGFRPDPAATRGIADWISVSPSPLSLAPMETTQVEITIEVPPSTPTGEYYGIVVAEPPPSAESVAVANRVGIRVYLSVGTGNEPTVDFAVGRMTAGRDPTGIPYVSTDLRNTGGRALDITGELALSDGPAGLSAGPFRFEGGITVAPGDLYPLRIELDPELPDGPWRAELTAVSGLLERTAEATITFPSDAGDEAEPAQSETIGGTDAEGNDISDEIRNQRRMLLPLAAILILLAIAALYLMLVWKRREQEEDDEEEPVAVGGTSAAGEDDGS